MGEVVCAYATSHILFDPDADPERAGRIVAGMEELGRRVSQANPDVLLVISSDHMFNMDLRVAAPFSVGISEQWTPWGDLGIPQRPFAGRPDFAIDLVAFAARKGFDLATCEGIKPDHGVTLPLLFVKPWGCVPVVPLFVNINMTPPPSPVRCYALATALREWIQNDRPAGERVAVAASGGLSHWLNIPGAGTVAEEFDLSVIDSIAAGGHADLAAMTTEQLLESAGNGGLEIMNWVMMAAMVPDAKGEKIYYEPMPAWLTGLGGISMHVQ